MSCFFESLRQANQVRQSEWEGAENITPLFRSNELGGEAGELLDAIDRRAAGVGASKDIFEELGDVIICLDLFCISVDLPPMREIEIASKHDEFPKRIFLLQEAVKKWHRTVAGIAGGGYAEDAMEIIATRVQMTLDALLSFARARNIDWKRATAEKFNKTSVKLGLVARMEVRHGG